MRAGFRFKLGYNRRTRKRKHQRIARLKRAARGDCFFYCAVTEICADIYRRLKPLPVQQRKIRLDIARMAAQNRVYFLVIAVVIRHFGPVRSYPAVKLQIGGFV